MGVNEVKEVIVFGTPDCGACKIAMKQLRPLVDNLRYVDCESNHGLANKSRIQSVPTILVMNDKEEVARYTGFSRTIQTALLSKLN